ncbi:hypothetical protein MMC12_005474 [Toensbergia leucococca]|nr:hypothetical protein [Toensbergia leucococca]
MVTPVSKKRKQTTSSTNHRNDFHRATKRVKTSSARTILAQTSDKALNQNGDLDVSAFVKAREYEIKAMAAGMDASKTSLNTRAFQQLPRQLRRRTASHNVKKVPKRLRAWATKEETGTAKMQDDNTPTVTSRRRKPTPHMRVRLETAKKLQKLGARAKSKRDASKTQEPSSTGPGKNAIIAPRLSKVKGNVLANPTKIASKFRKRQTHKSWLPTHLYHAKRAHMTPPKEPLWRYAIPLTPTDRSYRATHRAGTTRGCVAWDMSYMSTIRAEGVEKSLIGLLRCMGVNENMADGKRGGKWRRGTRGWEGWVRARDGERRWIARTRIIWCAKAVETVDTNGERIADKNNEKRKLFFRVHPSAFLQLWSEILKISKVQRPPIMIEDLRYEIGSIEITGPGSSEALIGVLHPILVEQEGKTLSDRPEKIWSFLGPVTNPASLPQDALLGFDISDPRLHYPPRTIPQQHSSKDNDTLLQVLSSWPPDTTQAAPSLFDRSSRLTASRCLPSQKAINRRKGAALPGAYPEPLPTDPKIPILLIASCLPSRGGQGSWTLLLPWKCVVPIWYSLMHYPLSSGGNPRFGGLKEKRQILFEQGVPWFPGDYPGTSAGWEWELSERAKRKAEWEKRPKGKRVAWESVILGEGRKGEIGRGWACDWERLFQGLPAPNSTEADKPKPADAARPARAATANVPAPSMSQVTTPNPPTQSSDPPLQIHHLPVPPSGPSTTTPPTALITIHLTLLNRGTPTPCARIYRLPTTNPTLLTKYLALATPPPSHRKQPPTLPKTTPQHTRTQHLAASLLTTPPSNQAPQAAGDAAYPGSPAEEDLIGFVTTGNFNLGEGRGVGVGCIAIAKVVGKEGGVGFGSNRREKWGGLCIIREAGQGLGRLARWEAV